MKCRQAKQWLFCARARAPLPRPVAQHLRGCLSCRHLRRQLLRVDAAVRRLPTFPLSLSARRRLAAALRR